MHALNLNDFDSKVHKWPVSLFQLEKRQAVAATLFYFFASFTFAYLHLPLRLAKCFATFNKINLFAQYKYIHKTCGVAGVVLPSSLIFQFFNFCFTFRTKTYAN